MFTGFKRRMTGLRNFCWINFNSSTFFFQFDRFIVTYTEKIKKLVILKLTLLFHCQKTKCIGRVREEREGRGEVHRKINKLPYLCSREPTTTILGDLFRNSDTWEHVYTHILCIFFVPRSRGVFPPLSWIKFLLYLRRS